MNLQRYLTLFKNSFLGWLKDNASSRAAALSFFVILPLPTLLLVVLAIFSQFLGPEQAIDLMFYQIRSFAGPVVASLFRQLVTNAGSPFGSVWTALFVVGFSVVGAIGAFSVLRDAMNAIWEVKLPKRKSFWKVLRQKLGPFVLLSVLGLVVIVWTALTTGFFNILNLFSINNPLAPIRNAVVQFVLSFFVSTALLAFVYKLIPETRVHWRDVSVAAVSMGLAFSLTNYILGAYVATFTVTTLIGAAGSLLIILLWIFLLNQIVLFGAELSKVYATSFGSHLIQHLPPSLEGLVYPIEKVIEKIEHATKDEYETFSKQEVDED